MSRSRSCTDARGGPVRGRRRGRIRSLMTAHIVVPAIAPGACDAQLGSSHGPAARRLGFTGVVDHRRARGIGCRRRHGRDGGGRRARARGRGPTRSASGRRSTRRTSVGVREAIVAAVTSGGGLPESRLVEAAERVASLQSWTRPRALPRAPGLGLDAARRALRVEGDARIEGQALVVELAVEPRDGRDRRSTGSGRSSGRRVPTRV